MAVQCLSTRHGMGTQKPQKVCALSLFTVNWHAVKNHCLTCMPGTVATKPLWLCHCWCCMTDWQVSSFFCSVITNFTASVLKKNAMSPSRYQYFSVEFLFIDVCVAWRSIYGDSYIQLDVLGFHRVSPNIFGQNEGKELNIYLCYTESIRIT